ncbi:flagellar protein export ATPase FliI [Agaribacterium sp. ZY112]|uniref:flagellar protein export ATPase FliI n=1 Tax=Agaribacterium sp. ZY112 TaxID=3233574 RepID=UPI003523B008
MLELGDDLLTRLQPKLNYDALPNSPLSIGRLTRMVGLTMEAVGLDVRVGHHCLVIGKEGKSVEAEVVGFDKEISYLMPIQRIEGMQPGALVKPVDRRSNLVMGEHLCGRVLNGLGQPLDQLGPLDEVSRDDFKIKHINPLHRHPIDEPLDVGIGAINGLLTVGKGQRIGLFAGSGVGKSVLLGMMTRFTEADIVVVGLIGERGREVKEFIDHILGEEGLKKAVVIASPADDAPLMRLRAAELASRVAEYFRDCGKNVLLLMDSLTRYAQAQREIALATGEPPATKGYPPSVFAHIPELVERAGNAEKGGGSVTAFYTVLTEGDDLQDPIADSARAILDGHIVLSRSLAEEGVYPAIDVEASISRVMPNIVEPMRLQQAQAIKRLLALYRANKDLVTIGAYTQGSDPILDEAIQKQPKIMDFVRQELGSGRDLATSWGQLETLLAAPSALSATAEAPVQSPLRGQHKQVSQGAIKP